ncbi:hypothetical protein BDV36DRAFT_250979 [Aspergillus pseudocaelatus]|uniref:Uncharacterized protein n=1 Tax=Aspergillus pseudocaelatus TaxID=1825620 RepID=A0ABQ6WRC1_9EURO|nr:hypothetical protein BDV36DRAFT_250979 [Aspergillus pseudocaelatus]
MTPNHYLRLAFKLLRFGSLARSILIPIRDAKNVMTPRPKELYPPRDASDPEIDEQSFGTHNPVTIPEDQSAEAPSAETSVAPRSLAEIEELTRSEDPAERELGETLQGYQMQLMLLELQYKRYKWMLEQERKASESSSS